MQNSCSARMNCVRYERRLHGRILQVGFASDQSVTTSGWTYVRRIIYRQLMYIRIRTRLLISILPIPLISASSSFCYDASSECAAERSVGYAETAEVNQSACRWIINWVIYGALEISVMRLRATQPDIAILCKRRNANEKYFLIIKE